LHDGINDYTCDCVDGFTDTNCSTNINECDPNPCENGGSCEDGINDFVCKLDCIAGFTDKIILTKTVLLTSMNVHQILVKMEVLVKME
jgi:hypothetical protein